jgi:MFS family permease
MINMMGLGANRESNEDHMKALSTYIKMMFAAGEMAGLIICGVGCAPVYPCVIHSTPVLFGKTHASAIMGLQMASAYVGSALAPPLFGLLAEGFSLSLLPLYLVFLVLGMAILTEMGWRRSKQG